jgi:hypothetical protein
LKRILVLAGLCLFLLAARAPAQISPGDLADAHAFLEGMKNCLKCHDLGEGPSDKKCLGCHKEIAVRIDSKQGYHHAVAVVGKKACSECHKDHAGRDYQLVHWPRGINNFDHNETNYRLEGKHAGLNCRDCHKAELIRDNMETYGEQVNVDRTFLGLHRDCLDCHNDEHRGQLPVECTNCHTQDGWIPAPGFDHASTRYLLTGRHRKAVCAGCHPTVEDPKAKEGNRATYARYTGIAFDNCARCHTDIHKGSMGIDCGKCHNTSAWLELDLAGFDHSRTAYPLLGRHAKVVCESCHTPGAKKKPLPHELCADCHAEAHQRQFEHRPDRGMCESCHTVDGFIPATYTVADHADTRFVLEGSHGSLPCFACHPTTQFTDGSTGRRFVIEDITCESCHQDIHYGQFSAAAKPKDCTDCHGVSTWNEVDFRHDRDSSYQLEGEHRRVPCGGCHVSVTQSGSTFVKYKPIDPSCKTCHTTEGLWLNTGNAGVEN